MNWKAAIKSFGAVVYKNRAKIETAAGIGLVMVGTGVIISKATKAADVHNEIEEKINYIRKVDAADDWTSKKERSQARRDVLKYAAVNYTRTYWLGLTCEALGLTLIAISDITMNKELSATSALLATTSAAFSNYRQRVIADQGEEKDQEYLLGPQFTTVDVMPDGTIIQTTNPLDNPNEEVGLPPHCFFFDESNPNWEKEPRINRHFLEQHQIWLNQKLQIEGFLFENDIRRDIGAQLVKSGWTSGIFAEDKDGNKNYLKLGLDAKNPAAQRFRDGVEPSIVIQLNVEDNIIDQINMPLI